MPEVVSPGHKLGQMVGNFFEELFADDLMAFCREHGFYCDRRGPRPKVRGTSKKITWTDKYGDKHDLDYVIEKGGSYDKQGVPVAFIELAWRRYTKHSRNKTGELQGSLLPLKETYQTCRFIGAILAGEYTDGGKNQLTSHDIAVLHIPFEVLAGCFRKQAIELDYPENAKSAYKKSVIRKWQNLPYKSTTAVKGCLREAIANDNSAFKKGLENALLRQIEVIRILPLYGTESLFSSVAQALKALAGFQEEQSKESKFVKFEVQLRFTDGDKMEGSFHSKEDAVHFLSMFS